MPWLNRPIYTLLLRLATPLLLLRLFWRGRKEPAYTQHIGHRLGFYGDVKPVRGALWLHAVSLGEMRTAALLLKTWREHNPHTPLLLTCSTATGHAEGAQLLDAYTQLVWLPWDMPGAVARFYRHFQPHVGLLMETEVWPNLLTQAQKNQTPVILINGRLSEKSLKKALRLPQLARPSYTALTGVLAQSAEDAERFTQLGSRILGISGNIKFDQQPNAAQIQEARALKAQWSGEKIIALASSREGEEALLLQALAKQALPAHSYPMLVPRHPQRFAEIAQLASAAGWQVLHRQDWPQTATLPAKTLLLGDSMGEMAFYYALSDIALMGGSFLSFGGQNLIEALACYCPVILGPHTYNFAQASHTALQAGLAQSAADMPMALALARQSLSQNPIEQTQFCKYLQQHQGGIQKTWQALQPWIWK
jgi:3-deoxy-D-manno-octulosonic-acid transferase